MNIKQVIVMRSDLKNTKGEKVRTGKLMAQAAHASMAFLTNNIARQEFDYVEDDCHGVLIYLKDAEVVWLNNIYTKIVLKVNSGAELLAVYDAANAAGLTVHLVTDAGLTEFANPTTTCLAIGPDEAEKIDAVTRNLSLY